MTEQALAHAHVTQCADCRAERASDAHALTARPAIEPSPGPSTAHVIGQIRLALSACTRATVSAIEDARARLTRGARRLPALALPSTEVAAGLVERTRFVGARVPRLLAELGSAGMSACRGAAHAASEGAGMALGFVSRSSGETVRVAGRVVAAGRLEAARTRDGIVRVGGRVPSLLAPSARAVGHLVAGIGDHVRAHPRIFAGAVSGVALVASALLLEPHLRPAHFSPRFSTGEEQVRDARLPVAPEPAEPIAATPLVIEVVPARPVSGPQLAPPPRAPAPARVPVPERRAAIPAPVRGSDSGPAEATPTAEPSDPAAAIDWLLKASGRRTETP